MRITKRSVNKPIHSITSCKLPAPLHKAHWQILLDHTIVIEGMYTKSWEELRLSDYKLFNVHSTMLTSQLNDKTPRREKLNQPSQMKRDSEWKQMKQNEDILMYLMAKQSAQRLSSSCWIVNKVPNRCEHDSYNYLNCKGHQNHDCCPTGCALLAYT
jgi:hypothetical protein